VSDRVIFARSVLESRVLWPLASIPATNGSVAKGCAKLAEKASLPTEALPPNRTFAVGLTVLVSSPSFVF
jgi:hypothetical protein